MHGHDHSEQYKLAWAGFLLFTRLETAYCAYNRNFYLQET